MGGSFGLIIGSSDGGSGDDFGYFRRPGFQIGSVDGSVCGSVDGSVGSVRWVFFFFFSFCCDAGFFFFFFLIWVFVLLGFW